MFLFFRTQRLRSVLNVWTSLGTLLANFFKLTCLSTFCLGAFYFLFILLSLLPVSDGVEAAWLLAQGCVPHSLLFFILLSLLSSQA